MSSKTDLGIPGFDVIATLDGGRNPVYRARSLISGNEVAIKVFDRLTEPVMPKLFDRRARTVGSLTRREIGFVPCVVSGDLSGRPYLVSPYYPDGSLADLMAHGPVPWARAVRLIERIGSIVAIAHDQDLVLGDLRPSAVLLSGFDTPVIAAFGMAAVRFDDGTPTYEAPERIDRAPLTPAADVFSLAAMLAALVLGRPRHRAEPVATYLEPMRDLAPAGVLRVVENALSQRPGNRYGSARLLSRALTAATANPGATTGAALDHVVGFGPTPPPPTAPLAPGPVPTGDAAVNGTVAANGAAAGTAHGPTRENGVGATNGRQATADTSEPVGGRGTDNDGTTPDDGKAPDLNDLVFVPTGDDATNGSTAEVADRTAGDDDLSDLLADIGLADESDAPPPPTADPVAVVADEADAAVAEAAVAETETSIDDATDGPAEIETDGSVTGQDADDADADDASAVAGTVPPPPTAADLIRLDDGGPGTDPTPVPATDEHGPDTAATTTDEIETNLGIEAGRTDEIETNLGIEAGRTDEIETNLGIEAGQTDETGELDEIDLRTGNNPADDDPTDADEQTGNDPAATDGGTDDPTWPRPADHDTEPPRDSWGPAEADQSVLHAATSTVDFYAGQFADEPIDRSGSEESGTAPEGDDSTRRWVAPAAAFAGSATDDDGFGTLEIESLSDLGEPDTASSTMSVPSGRLDLRDQPTIDIDHPLADALQGPAADVDHDETLDPGSLPPSVAAMAATTIDLAALDVLYGRTTGDEAPTDNPVAEASPDRSEPIELTTLDDVALPLVDADGNGAATKTGEFNPSDFDTSDFDAPTNGLPAGADTNGGDHGTAYDFSDDPTHIFPDDGLQAEQDRQAEPVGAAPPFAYPPADTGAEIPFTPPSVRYGVEHVGRWRRLGTRLELAWFNSRRRISNLAAIIGVFLIAAVAVYFGARELQRTTIDADEGVPLAPTTTTEPRASRNAPIVTDLPDTNPTTTTRPPRRATTTEPPTTTAAPTTTVAPTTARPTTTEEPTTTRRRRTTTTEAPTTTRRRTTTTEAPTTTRRRTTTTRRTTTEAPTTTEQPTTTEEETTTTTRRGRPTTTEEPDEDDEDLPFAAPPTISSPDIAVTSNSASISYRSDQCVATRFLLTGEDGTRRRGSSPGFDADITCSSAWNLDFSGGNGLQPDTGYSLTVSVRAKDSGLTTDARFSFRTSP